MLGAQSTAQVQLSQVEKPASAVGQLEVPQEASASVAAPSTVDANPAIQPSAPPPPAPTLEVAALANTRDLAVIASQVVKEFDPSHQLAELTSSWAGFMAGASSFDERLKAYTQAVDFSGAKEVENRLNAEINRLKEEHAQKEAEWGTERQNHDQFLIALQANVVEAEKRKTDALEALNNMTKKVELTENKWKAEQDETKRLSGDLKALIDTLRAKHNEV